MKKMLFLGLVLAIFSACSNTTHSYIVKTSGPSAAPAVSAETQTAVKIKKELRNQSLPNATAFRMSGDYANNVAVTLGPNGQLTYFPAPTDITADSEPISLGNGWWLNCQGIGQNSVFTKYTFAEYASLATVPTPEQIKASIIPGARVTQMVELPFKASEAVNNIDEVKKYIKGL